MYCYFYCSFLPLNKVPFIGVERGDDLLAISSNVAAVAGGFLYLSRLNSSENAISEILIRSRCSRNLALVWETTDQPLLPFAKKLHVI